MKIEGQYIVLNKSEYLETLDHIRTVVKKETYETFGGGRQVYWRMASDDVYERHGQMDDQCIVWPIVEELSKLQLAKRFDVDTYIIDTTLAGYWPAITDVIFDWNKDRLND